VRFATKTSGRDTFTDAVCKLKSTCCGLELVPRHDDRLHCAACFLAGIRLVRPNVYDAGVTGSGPIASASVVALLADSERQNRNPRGFAMQKIVCGLTILMACTVAAAQDSRAKRVLKKCEAMRPGDQELAMYRLDWADSLEEAKQRAAKEGRPIFLVIIHAKYGDISSGHC